MLVRGFIVLTTALLGSASAATSSTSKGPSRTQAVTAATHTFSVGDNGHHFTPSQVNASVGDIIEYRFYPQNHSVARAAYGQPCIPYEYTAAGRVGFWSGFFPVQLVLSDPPKFQIRVNDTEPIFFYCSAPGACLDGMIGVINPNETFSFENQFSFLENTTQAFSPGENPFPEEVAKTSTSSSATMTSTSTPTSTATSSSYGSGEDEGSSKHHSGLGGGPIAGIVIGSLAFAFLAAVVIWMCARQKTIKEVIRHTAPPPTNTYQPTSPGLSEAHYPNMQKTGFSSIMSGRFSSQTPYGPSTETESYRSASPPIDERTGMMHGVMHPGSFGPGYPLSPGSAHMAGQNPMYFDTPEADGSMKPYPNSPGHPNPESNAAGPHELPSNAATSELDPSSPRPFSYTESESGYAQQRDRKPVGGLTR